MNTIIKMLTLFVLWISLSAQAFTPEWITQESRGRVKYRQASEIVSLVHRFAFQYEVDPALVFRIIRVESNFNPRAHSHANARGLMQVVPKWHREKILGRNLFLPEVGIEVGVRVIAEYLQKYQVERRALRAYYGDHRSDTYPNKIYSVRPESKDETYAGADDRDQNYYVPQGEFMGPPDTQVFLAYGLQFTVTHHPDADSGETHVETNTLPGPDAEQLSVHCNDCEGYP